MTWRSGVPQRAEGRVDLDGEGTGHGQRRSRAGGGSAVAGGYGPGVEEAGELAQAVPVVAAAPVVMQPQRHVQVQVVAGPGQRDVEQAVFLGQPVRVTEGHVAGQRAVDQVRDVHDRPLQALGGVDGGDGQVVLVQAGRSGQVGGGHRRVQGQLGERVVQ